MVLVAALTIGGAAPAGAQVGGYTPPRGVVINDPLGDPAQRRAITDHLIRSIDSTPPRGRIRIASWNFRSRELAAALIRAHRRNVVVRLILSAGNAGERHPNGSIRLLRRGLHGAHNGQRPVSRRSRVVACAASCRGTKGIAHSKFYLFSRSGGARWVVMNGSFNATDVAAHRQWNDLVTVRGRRKVYREFLTTFREMYRDQPVRQGYRSRDFGSLALSVFPYVGRRTVVDPVLKELNKTVCAGARHGTDGRTKVRIAMTSWLGERGIRIARRIRQMQVRGCDVQVIYAVMGTVVRRVLRLGRPGKVSLRQIVQDLDGDGASDRYLHTKVMTINGVHRGDPAAWVTLTGSANWTPKALVSDDVTLMLFGRSTVRRYNTWIQRLFKEPPADPGRKARKRARRQAAS